MEGGGGGGGGGGGFVQSERDKYDRRIFWGFEIFPSGIFRVGKFGKYIFGCLDVVGFF